ncbi:MAG: hypothetical protein HWN68_18280 [Desulfobacterales bacterium]|nr:hypothetical protein [Desulfobacterales bacterium]
MGYREENFWAIEARKLELEDEIILYDAVRTAMGAKSEEYVEKINRLIWELKSLEEEY